MAIIKIRNAAIDLDAAEIPNLPASKITSGTLDNARISLDAAEIPNLDTAKITSGTLADARVPNLNASKITAGTIATARLGSGTASSSTFLRGDGSFATPIGGTNTPNFHAYQNATQGTILPQNTFTKVVFDSEYYDSDNALATGRFTVPSGKAGKYFFSSTITMNISLAEINMYLYKNGSQFIRGGAQNDNNGSTQMVNGSMDLSVGDYVEVYVRQNQSSNRVEGLVSGSSHSSFNGFKIIE